LKDDWVRLFIEDKGFDKFHTLFTNNLKKPYPYDTIHNSQN